MRDPVHLFFDSSIRDVKHAARSFLRKSGFAASVVLTLALGIGANTAIFSIVDRLLLRPLPYPNGEQLVVMHENGRAPHMDVSPANWLDWQRESKSFDALAAWTSRLAATLTGQGEPEQLKTQVVSHEFFPLLGVQPLLGRVFRAEDDMPGARSVAVLSYSLWRRKFGGDAGIVGKTMQLNGAPVEIVGVMPAQFRFLASDTDVWGPFRLDRNFAWRERAGRFLQYVVGRVKPGVQLTAAQTEMQTIARRLGELYAFNKGTSVRIIPLREAMTGEVRNSLLALFAAVAVLLLIACSNVANLLLARSVHRRREIAIRMSLGAGRGTIVQQLLTESVLLALVAGIVSVFIAKWGISVLLALTPANLLQTPDVPIDRWVLLYTLGLSLITGAVVGLAPVFPAMGADVATYIVATYIKDGSRSVTSSNRLRSGLIVAQVAMTVVLLCTAGLLVRTRLALNAVDTGVKATNVLSMHVELPVRYNRSQQVAFFQQVVERLKDLPGVQSASAARDIPMQTLRLAGTGFQTFGRPRLPPSETPGARVRVVTPDYFKTLGIPLLKGRDFTQQDMTERAPQVFVVNDTFAKKYFPEDPLAARISVAMGTDDVYGQIIGVVGDVREGSLRGVPEPTVFYNHRQLTYPGMSLLIRSSRGADLTRDAIQVVRDLDRDLAVTEVQMLDKAFADTAARERLNAVVSGAFGVCALMLASIGLYGLLAFTVVERSREIGIRMALGAEASRVLRMVLGQGLRLVALGAVLGLIAAFAAARFLEGLLFGITTHDPVTFAGVAALLVIVTVIAVMIPARSAARVDPLVVLREE